MSGTWASGWALNDIVTVSEFAKGLGSVADTTLGAPAASIDFTSLPPTYAHLLIVVYGRQDGATAADKLNARFNGDAGANYAYNNLLGQNSVASSALTTGSTSVQVGGVVGTTGAANRFAISHIWIPHYANASNDKTTIGSSAYVDTTAANSFVSYLAGIWLSTAAINRVTLLPGTGNFVTGTRATVYVMGA